jgi:type I restriction-modification system DNA methylase subunit
MALFQKSVLNKFIKSQDAVKIEAAYQRFSDIFQQVDRQAEIRSMKEEEYQDGFLDDLFVNILGYIKRPNAGFNLVREKKNEADSKKADGAILKNDMPLAVIELKGTDTTDLDKVTNQGFGYKNNHKECVYVVISNFEKLRFFIHHAVDYIEFNLFTLSKEEFTTLWLCLHSDNLLDNIPAKIKAESVVKEEDITKNLYKDYSTFKQELWQDIVKLNPNGDPLQFYKKTQKLIDRFLFIFFTEDAGLLPPNSISRMVERWQMLKDEDAYKPLYDIFKQYFGYLNTGRPGKTPQDEIFAYNGGLMLEDEILESITISDDVLLKHVSRLTTYDFSSEVDVNILGHIFENSLNDIEAVTAELKGQEIDKTKTKRKKDGVFYTPKYITKYIVDNTVGKLCDEKKVELEIIDEEYAKGRTNRKKETLKQLDKNLQAYRSWLLNITICDPACGSGAFLNQALEYLMEEHRYIDELESLLLGAGFTFPGVENHILENNIFGVDINDESIEIAKFSLWLRTAQRGRKLTSLNNNIKCGNSLIDDPEVAGEKAFNWQKEFPSVFDKGGFDVVIGNPPYFNVETLGVGSIDVKYLQKSYSDIWQDKSDILFYFMFKALELSKSEIGFIISNAYLFSDKAKKLRNELLNSGRLTKIVNFEKYLVFKDASITSCISLFSKKHHTEHPCKALIFKEKDYSIQQVINYINDLNNEFDIEFENDKVFALVNNAQQFLNKKIDSEHPTLSSICHIGSGMQTGANSIFLFEEFPNQFNEKFIKKRMIGENIGRYKYTPKDNYILYIEDIDDFETFPASIQNHLLTNRNFLENRADKKRRSTSKWWNYTFAMHKDFYKLNKIWCSYRGNSNAFFLDESSDYIGLTNTTVIFENNPNVSIKYILALLNSKLLNYRYKSIGKQTGGGVFEYFANGVGKLTIPLILLTAQESFVLIVEKIISLNNELVTLSEKFQRTIRRKFNLTVIPKKLEYCYLLSYADFLKELTKLKVKLSLTEETEWEDYFLLEQQKSIKLKSEIDQTDKEIDRMVYELYGLTEEEIKVVEES